MSVSWQCLGLVPQFEQTLRTVGIFKAVVHHAGNELETIIDEVINWGVVLNSFAQDTEPPEKAFPQHLVIQINSVISTCGNLVENIERYLVAYLEYRTLKISKGYKRRKWTRFGSYHETEYLLEILHLGSSGLFLGIMTLILYVICY